MNTPYMSRKLVSVLHTAGFGPVCLCVFHFVLTLAIPLDKRNSVSWCRKDGHLLVYTCFIREWKKDTGYFLYYFSLLTAGWIAMG